MLDRPAENTAPLPEWDLSDLYAGPDAPEIEADLAAARQAAEAFETKYAGKLSELDGHSLAEAVAAYESIEEGFGRLMSYASLLYAADLGDPAIGRFHQTMMEKINDIAIRLVFFTLELNGLEETTLTLALAQSPKLARYRPWLEDVRKLKPHQLSADMEKLLHDKAVTGRAAWVRLFDETMAALRFAVTDPETGETEELGAEETLHLLSDRDGAKRRAAADALTKTFKENVRLFTLITNTLAKDKEVEDRWRHFERPESARHLANQVEPEVVDALVSSVKSAYPRLSHRYYRLKAKWLGKDKLDFWDRNAPLPEDTDEHISWNAARELVLGAYGKFSPKLAEIGARFFQNPWIDAPVRDGKSPGAFAHPTVPGVHPYLFLNYMGKARDVMTLAHELGHGVHQVLAAPQGLLLADTPLTLAETASVFGEMLAFKALLAAAPDARRRRILLASKIEDMLNTVVRQIAFFEFERRLHDARRSGELSAEDIAGHWLAVQSESLGDGIRLNEGYEIYWCYIPHFIHSPFYVYAYAFGDCLVNSLYAAYEAAPEGFAEKYLALLAAGGSKRHRELLAPFGLDAADPAFWQRGLDVIAALIDELEAQG